MVVPLPPLTLVLYLLLKNLFDHIRVGLVPAAKHVYCEWQFDLSELRLALIERLIRHGTEIVFDERLLCLIGPQVINESLHDRTLSICHAAVDDHYGMLAVDR